MTAGLSARRRARPSVAACVNHGVGVSASMTMYVSAQRPRPSRQCPDPIHISFIRAVLQQIVWRNSELIAWFYASSFKQGSHMALRTVKRAILWRGRRRCADRRADTPGVHRKWTFPTVSCCHCCQLPGGRTSNKPVRWHTSSWDVLHSVTRSRASRYVPRHRRGMSVLHQNKAADSLKRTRETSENELSTVPAPSLWCYVNQHDDWRCLRVNGRPRRLKRVMEVVFVTAAFHSAHHRRLRRWLQIIVSVKWNLIK